MTLAESAIRARNAAYLAENPHNVASVMCRVPCEDRAWALAEVDRLTAENEWMKSNQPGDLQQMYSEATQAERARILAAVEELPDPPHNDNWGVFEEIGWDHAIAAVVATIKGETT